MNSISTNFSDFPHTTGFFSFSRTMGNWLGDSCISHIIKYTIGYNLMGKECPYYGKIMSTNFPGFLHTMGLAGLSWEAIPQAFSIRWIFLSFLMLWETDGKNHAFPIWWSILQDGNLMEKLTHFINKNMRTNFPGPPHSMGFAEFSNPMENLMRRSTHFLCDEVYHRMGI